MRFRSMILVLTIAFSAIFMSMLGTSYAYYVSTDGTTINATTSNMDVGVAVVFEQSQYINVNTGVPINASDVNLLASKSVFTIKPDTEILSGANVNISIGIMDLYIDKSLVVNDFKYNFICNDGSTDVISKSGNGTEFTTSVINNGYFELGKLMTITTDGNSTFDVNKEYTCTLRLWIQESGSDQNNLMNKKFRGLIKVSTLFMK